MNKRNNFEDSIKKKLDGYQQQPPDDLWNSIEYSLNRKSGSKWISVMKYAASITLIAAVAYGLYFPLSDILYQSAPLASNDEKVASGQPALEKSEIIAVQHSDSYDIIEPVQIVTEKLQTPPIYYSEADHVIAKETDASTEETDIQVYELLADNISAYFSEETLPPLFNVAITSASMSDEARIYNEKNVPYLSEDIIFTDLDDDISDFNRWSVGFNAAPQYAFRFNSSNPQDLTGAKSIFERNENHIFSYNLGFNAIYKLTGRFEIESGFNFSSMGQSIHNIAVKNIPEKKDLPLFETEDNRNPFSLLTSMGEILFDDPTLYFEDMSRTVDERTDRVKSVNEVKLVDKDGQLTEKTDRLNQHIDFIEIPLVLRYNLYDRLFKIQLKSGLSVNYLINNKVVLHRDDMKNSIGKTNLIRDWNFCYTGGAALIYPVTNNLNFHFEPTLNMFVSSMTEGREYNVHPYGISVYAGISISL